MRRMRGLLVQKTSTQRRMMPSAVVDTVGASTRNPQKMVMNQQKLPSAELEATVTLSRTPPAVITAIVQSSDCVPKGRNCTESIAGSARPMKHAGIQTTNWSLTTCLYHRRQRGRDSS